MSWGDAAPFVTLFLGLVFGHLATVRAARLDLRRKQRTEYLIGTYRALETAGNRPLAGPDEARRLESAIADVFLFGTVKQQEAARSFAREFERDRIASLDDVLDAVRFDLRSELGLEAGLRDRVILRITDAPS